MKKTPSTIIALLCFMVVVVLAVGAYFFSLQRNSVSNANNFLAVIQQKVAGCTQFTNLRDALQSPESVCSLNLQNEQLTGALPGEIRFMKNLTSLNVSNNLATGIPAEIGQLTVLKSLDYSLNQLDTMPNEIAHLSHLQFLSLAHNKYRELPESVTQITSLVTLDLSNNVIVSLPTSIQNLKNLRELRVTGNLLSAADIQKMQQLLPKVQIIQ